MTRPDGEFERLLTADVESAFPVGLRRQWNVHLSAERVVLGRQAIFSPQVHVFGYELGFRTPESTSGVDASGWSEMQHERATSAVLRATFGRAEVDQVGHGRWLFVRCPRAFLVGELPLPACAERLVVEVPARTRIDDDVVAGVRWLRERGARVAVSGFVARPDQRMLLPYADFVKIDARELDVEGEPVVDLARSHKALIVAEFVESGAQWRASRQLGFDLYQGNLLEKCRLLDRSGAPVIGCSEHDSSGRVI